MGNEKVRSEIGELKHEVVELTEFDGLEVILYERLPFIW